MLVYIVVVHVKFFALYVILKYMQWWFQCWIVSNVTESHGGDHACIDGYFHEQVNITPSHFHTKLLYKIFISHMWVTYKSLSFFFTPTIQKWSASFCVFLTSLLVHSSQFQTFFSAVYLKSLVHLIHVTKSINCSTNFTWETDSSERKD